MKTSNLLSTLDNKKTVFVQTQLVENYFIDTDLFWNKKIIIFVAVNCEINFSRATLPSLHSIEYGIEIK